MTDLHVYVAVLKLEVELIAVKAKIGKKCTQRPVLKMISRNIYLSISVTLRGADSFRYFLVLT